MNKQQDAREYAPATQRNREPILNVLLRVLPPSGNILEIASGTGEHAIFFAPRLAPRRWIPSEPSERLRASITAWRDVPEARRFAYRTAVDNLDPPLYIDARDPIWNVDKEILAIVNINMIHITPWSACLGLIAGANRLLPSKGILYLYGAYKIGGEHTAYSNLVFDQSLRSQNPEWGVRDLEEVVKVANTQGLTLRETIEMPANNLSIVFQKH